MVENIRGTQGLGPGALLLHGLARNWWLLLLRGIVSVLFGVLAFAWPGLTLVTLVLLYGAFALLDGAFALVAAILGAPGLASRWWLALVGVFGIAAGVLTFALPGLTALTLLVVIGSWALVKGGAEIIGAVRLRKEIDNEWALILNGALSVIIGLIFILRPGDGALALVWVIGAYAVVIGILMIALSLRLRKHAAPSSA